MEESSFSSISLITVIPSLSCLVGIKPFLFYWSLQLQLCPDSLCFAEPMEASSTASTSPSASDSFMLHEDQNSLSQECTGPAPLTLNKIPPDLQADVVPKLFQARNVSRSSKSCFIPFCFPHQRHSLALPFRNTHSTVGK